MKENPKKNQEFLDLCRWVEKEIFGYDENQRLQSKACMRLQGLRTGQVIANNSHEKNGDYSIDVILTTFKLKKDIILRAINHKDFTSEENKMAYVCAIVRNNINEVYSKMKAEEKSKARVYDANINSINNVGASYQTKTEERKEKDKKFEELW